MTKHEAIAAMLNGSKVTHRFFQFDEFIYMESGKIFDELGYHHEQFWEMRLGEPQWEIDWSIYRGEE